jgi:hypothetical protein
MSPAPAFLVMEQWVLSPSRGARAAIEGAARRNTGRAGSILARAQHLRDRG